jgi:ketosteroid isomerase-like protein
MQPMNQEVLVLFDAMNRRDFSGLEAILLDNVIFDFPGAGKVEGKVRVITFLKVLMRKYPRLVFTVKDIIAENDKACVTWTNEGNDSQGNPYRNEGITLFHFSGQKITFLSDYFKDTSFTKPVTR